MIPWGHEGFEMHKRLILGYVTAALLISSASADTIKDPAAGVEADNFSSAISTFVGTFSPTDNNGVIGFYNDTGSLIVSLSLHTTIAAMLTPADISSSFSCNSGTANPFFLNCGFLYDSSSGSLTVNFFGVNPPDGDELDGSDSEVGERQGIPPVPAPCLSTPDLGNCIFVGHFAFVFNDGFQKAGNVVNEWVPTTTSTANPNTLLFNGPPRFDPPGFTIAAPGLSAALPEPGSFLLVGSAVFALARLSRRRVR
jgi:hypothetical protein